MGGTEPPLFSVFRVSGEDCSVGSGMGEKCRNLNGIYPVTVG